MKKTWVLVADEAIVRILQMPQDGDELEDVEQITDAAAHADSADLRRDAYGRRAGSAPQGARQGNVHRLTPTSSITASAGEEQMHLEAEGFARRVAEHLSDALHRKRFDELRIVAAPRFLGMLRKALSHEVSRLVVDEVDKDLIHEANRDITQRLFPRPSAGGAPR
ncbi:host attachment protein [Aquabacterium sp. A7-Y]|uniref:host attachment protein n=1 Tax=Aquabacterium sp. A7-Y TaxID=1349605 RepID=UPI00223E6A9D|nr:host attachment protein [Aquabacterium sp. A7-Y]MCW7538438.1 host attachment protein [Aquabacterium sp. A7-Y]